MDTHDNTYDDMMVDFSQCTEIKKSTSLYDKKYDETTTKFYRTLRENKINAIMQDNTGFDPEQSFCFEHKWDPYTGIRDGLDPYGPLYFHPDDLIRYFYIKRLNMLWTEPIDLNQGYYIQGYYGDAVGSGGSDNDGDDIFIVGRGTYPESYLFRLPILDCYLQENCDMSLITMGPKLTINELQHIDTIAEKNYKNNYRNQYGKNRPSLVLMMSLYNQAISKNPDLEKLPEYQTLKKDKLTDIKLTDLKLIDLKNKANRIAVDALKNM